MQEQRISTILWRGKWIILASLVVATALAVVITKRTAKVYEATAIIQVNAGSNVSPGQGLNDVQLANQVLASTYSTLIQTKSFLEQVKGQIAGGRYTASDLQSRTSATAIPNTALVSLTTRGASPDEARLIATDLTSAFVTAIRAQAAARSSQQQDQLQQRIQSITRQIAASHNSSDIDALRSARTQLQAQLADVVSSGIQQGEVVSVPSPPTASTTPVAPRPLVNLVAGLLLGLIVGTGLAWARMRLDRGLHGSREAEELLGLPVLATIPIRRRFSTDDAVLGEAFDVFRANLAFLSLDEPLQVVTLTSFNPREGKTSTSEGLAFAGARGGLTIAVVDADVRTRTLSTRLGHADAPGLTSIVVGAATLDEALVEIAPGVELLPAGPTPPNPPSLLGSGQMRELVAELRERYSLVVIDAPPVAHLADASILASVSDGVVLVARVGVTARADLAAAAENLRHSPVPIVGAVVLERLTIDETYYPALTKGAQRAPEAAETI